MQILEHHIFNLRNFLRTPQDISAHVTTLSRRTTENGQLEYHGLQIPTVRQQYKQTLLQMKIAIQTGQYTRVKDFNDSGQPNFDALCDLCGNKMENTCTKLK